MKLVGLEDEDEVVIDPVPVGPTETVELVLCEADPDAVLLEVDEEPVTGPAVEELVEPEPVPVGPPDVVPLLLVG